MPRHGGKYYKTKKRTKAASTIQRAWRGRRKTPKPRHTVSKNPMSSPNKYNFMRSFASSIAIGLTDPANNIFMNTDGKAQIIKFRVKANQLPDFSDFGNLFNQYRITSMRSHLIPFYKDNIPSTQQSGIGASAVPNYQVFYVPENFMTDIPDFHNKNITQIDDYINQSQKKAYAIFPNRTKTFLNKRPSVPDAIYSEKAGVLNPSKMVPFPFLDCDQTGVEAYGLQLIIMRVDRLAFNTTYSNDPVFQHMGWRVQNDVYIQTRKVQ